MRGDMVGQRIERTLQDMSSTMRISLYVAVVAIMLVLVWWYWYVPYDASVASRYREYETIQKQISKQDIHRYDTQNRQLQAKLLRIKSNNQKQKNILEFVERKIRDQHFDFLWYDENNFIKLLKTILSRSAELGLKVDSVETPEPTSKDDQASTNKASNTNIPIFAVQKHVEIEGSGEFKSIVELLYFIESSNFLLEISDIKMVYDANRTIVDFGIGLDQYGMVQ